MVCRQAWGMSASPGCTGKPGAHRQARHHPAAPLGSPIAAHQSAGSSNKFVRSKTRRLPQTSSSLNRQRCVSRKGKAASTREKRVMCGFSSSPSVTEMMGLIKPVNLQQSKQNPPGAGKLPGAPCEMRAAHQGILRTALLREKDLRLL